jgi:hypothetical protein
MNKKCYSSTFENIRFINEVFDAGIHTRHSGLLFVRKILPGTHSTALVL